VIVATGELPLRAAASATSTIPVVFTIGSDPVQSGLVASLARPDGNITGFTAIATQLVSKRFELVSELLPQAKKIAVLINSSASAVSEVTIGLAQQAVSPKGIQLLILKADDGSSLEAAFASIAQEHADAIVVSADAFFFLRREQITALAARYVVPTIYELQGFVDAGGLISYGPNVAALRRQVGIYNRENPQGGQAGGPADPATDKVRSGAKSQDCQSARPHRASVDTHPRRRGDRMRRREFITLLGASTFAWPLAARAQQATGVRRVAFLHPYAENDAEVLARVIAFREGLESLGWDREPQYSN